MEVLLRPQPVGVFSVPVSLLLLPALEASGAGRGGESLRRLLLADRVAPLPEAWAFYGRALRGESLPAADSLGGGQLGEYNRFVLFGGVEEYGRLRGELRGELAVLLEVAAFYHGLADTLPDGELMNSLGGELRALALMMRASQALEQERSGDALSDLAAAAELVRTVSPVFAVHLLRQMAQLVSDPQQAIGLCRDAAQLISACVDERLRAETWIHLGQACQANAGTDRVLLVDAVQAYQEALRCGVTLESHPDLFALTQNYVGLAYLAMPMREAGDHLRTGVAIQSFREALRVYDRESSPELWISTQLNLANALQYMKSSHPEENLAQAVEIYEELLSMRQRAYDPVGHARILANQANALAHLGCFGPAMEKATEAHKLFHWHNEPQLAATMLELASEINSRLGNRVETGVR
jgi:tetratricopeptide (TPR) repeat protein